MTEAELLAEIERLQTRLEPYEPWIRLTEAQAAVVALHVEQSELDRRKREAQRALDKAAEQRTLPQIEAAQMRAKMAEIQSQVAALKSQIVAVTAENGRLTVQLASYDPQIKRDRAKELHQQAVDFAKRSVAATREAKMIEEQLPPEAKG